MEEKKRILKKINSECFGGSENQLRLLLKNLPDENFKNINLILNNTNPSLIEAMSCKSCIIAHDNVFNKSVLGEECLYFNSMKDISKFVDNIKKGNSSSGSISGEPDKIISLRSVK